MGQKDQALIQVRDLEKDFRHKQKTMKALQGVSFSVQAGESVGYLGPNGAGKTTTLRILLGLLRPSAGTAEVRARRIGFVLDTPSLYSKLTLRQNLAFYAEILKVAPPSYLRWAEEFRLTEHLDKRVMTFSLGMGKKAEIARALMTEPDLLVLDEPSSGLDPAAQADLRAILRALSAKGVSILVTSHDLYNVQQICQRYIFIKDGRIVMDQSSGEISTQELEKLYIEKIGA